MTVLPEPHAAANTGGFRVLIIDDDDDERRIVTRLLVRAGIPDVIEASDADAGLAAAAEHQPHLILLDLAMPGRSGSDVLPELIASAPAALVVILSNLSRQRLAPGLMHTGAVGFVEKLVPPERLVHEILVAATLTDIARRHVLDLPNESSAPMLGRRFAGALLADTDLSIAGDVTLLVSELISNAVIHASCDARLEVHISRAHIRVAVRDASQHQPEPRVPDLTVPGGRGLHLVEKLASRWGVDTGDHGKRVWFEIDREPAAER